MPRSSCHRRRPEPLFTITFDPRGRPWSATYGFLIEGRLQPANVLKDVGGLTMDQILHLSPQEFNQLPAIE